MQHRVLYCFTVLRGSVEPAILSDSAVPSTAPTVTGNSNLASPFQPPHADMSSLYGLCSPATIEILDDMHNLTHTYLARCSYATHLDSASDNQVASYEAQQQQIYARLLGRPQSDDAIQPDWIYESCRIAALIYCRSIVHGISMSESARATHPWGPSPDSPGMTLLCALHAAVARTDTHSCWNNMRGVFLWVCLVGGSASWPSSRRVSVSMEEGDSISSTQAWMKKFFALHTIKAAVSVPFDIAEGTMQALRTVLQLRHSFDVTVGSQTIT